MGPELNGIKGAKIHMPWVLSVSELRAANVSLGETYPKPMVTAPEWSKHAPKAKHDFHKGNKKQRGVDFYFKSSGQSRGGKK